MDAGGRVIYQSMVRPMHLDDWDSGESAITPANVADAPLIGDCLPDIQRVVDGADEVVCYDAGPTLRLLRAAGVEVPQWKVVDVLDCFARTVASMEGSGRVRRLSLTEAVSMVLGGEHVSRLGVRGRFPRDPRGLEVDRRRRARTLPASPSSGVGPSIPF